MDQTAESPRNAPDPEPDGHREGPPVTDDTVREAGENR
jgi:hypothetical protein